ncbi:FecR family protein [Chitinophaga sp. RAB17]|uniref:FecR family protein n=1 Tax=Chitinophaga sp. RAB17 TaxID=3233049 RepID=UPI003F93573C
MKTDKEYLTQLVLFEISGKIQEDEKAELSRMIREDQEAADLYAQLHITLPQNTTSSWGPDEVWEAIRRRKQQRIIGGSIKGLAVVFVAALLGFLFMMPKHTIEPPTFATNKGHVKLQLSGGQMVDLSSQQGQVQAGSVALNNQHKQLHFSNDATQVQYATITVPAGKDYTVHLPDGSEVQLNAETQLLFPLSFTGPSREITVRGEAYIKVAAAENQPFFVHLPGATVQVLGTEFNVNTYDSNKVKVALVKGAVKMNTDRDTALLKPGYVSELTTGKQLSMYRYDVDDVLAWRQGLHLFNNASVEEVAMLIHRFYGIPVQLDMMPEHRKPFTGFIDRNKPAANFLEGLKFAQYADYYFDKDSALHLRPLR